MSKKEKSAAIETLSFEAAAGELEQIVDRLESGQAALEEALACYTRGIALKNHCEQKLRDARLKVEAVQVNAAGDITPTPFDNGN